MRWTVDNLELSRVGTDRQTKFVTSAAIEVLESSLLPGRTLRTPKKVEAEQGKRRWIGAEWHTHIQPQNEVK